ncbi:MAG: hypothetical protein ACTSUT_16220, partial [Promethearchaeota archaeon]
KKLEGIVDRFVPMEPFFELFTNESEIFRNEIAVIKDKILAGQSTRFEKLEIIQDKSIEEVKNEVDAQIKDFFEDSDIKNKNKKERIDNAKNRFTDTSKTLERNHHAIMDGLNSDLKSICSSNVRDNEDEIKKIKGNLNNLIAELLEDFSKRVNDLDKELKMNLDEHVERHKDISSELKPKMEQILEKYLERMDKIITDLKTRISNLLREHVNHLKSTTELLQTDMKSTIENRHGLLTEQTNDFKQKSLTLLDNLLESSNRFTDFSQDIAKKGFFWVGKKPKYKARYEEIKENIISISDPLREDFTKQTSEYINNTRETTNNLKKELTDIISKENDSLTTETTGLDHKAQESINVELEILATDMAVEINNTLQSGVKDCSDTSLKLKDTLESSLTQHHKKYEEAIKNHEEFSLKHYTKFDRDVKKKNETWTQVVNDKFSVGKRDCSEKIDAEINIWNEESANMDKNLSEMLENHKSKYEKNAKTLEENLSNTTRDNIQNVKDEIANFTLEFMNSIDDSTELAEKNEDILNDIFKASSSIPEIGKITTWHTIGRDALISCIKDAIYRVKSSIIIVTPVVIPEILQVISEIAFQKKAARFMITSHWDMNLYGNILSKMKQLGNIQFRQLSQAGDYYAVTRDAEEVIIAPYTNVDSQIVSIVSNQMAYAKLYSQFIGPIFQANSRPIK